MTISELMFQFEQSIEDLARYRMAMSILPAGPEKEAAAAKLAELSKRKLLIKNQIGETFLKD